MSDNDSAAPAPSHRDTGVAPSDFKEFDILFIGGGTSGLAAAARIAQESDLTVGVLEAGLWRPDDPKINVPAFIGQSLMQPDYDWGYMTVPQEHSNNRQWAWPRGKVLGGSSALNFLVWQRGHSAEYDAWANALGNQGWSWKDLEPFFKKSATMLKPRSQLQADNFATIEEEMHGSQGPVKVSFSAWYTEPQKSWMKAMKDLGFNNNVDGLRGENTGVWTSPATLDQDTWRRSYSASAHYEPNRQRQNFKVLCGAEATQIILDDSKTATGVKYVHGGKEYTVKAKKEVVLSGGAINSPALLELSGIGSPEVLEKAGVPVKVALDGVGKNLQEHIYCGAAYELVEGIDTWDSMRKPDFMEKAMKSYFSQDVDRGVLASAFSGFAYLPLQQIMSKEEVDQIKGEVKGLLDRKEYYSNEAERMTAQEYLRELDDERIPSLEYIFAPGWFTHASPPSQGKNYFTILTCLQHPMSRGSIHITSSDPKERPRIDPRYFSVRADLDIMSKGMMYCDEMVRSPHLRDIVTRRCEPAVKGDGEADTASEYDEYVKNHSSTEYHHSSTCSMLPEEKGGVVDPALRVYGVKNLRVADASICPLVPSSHIVSMCYAIGEKAADLILRDHAST